jgi:hypothetical protein
MCVCSLDSALPTLLWPLRHLPNLILTPRCCYRLHSEIL